VELTVRNQLLRSSPVVTVCDPFEDGRRTTSFLVAPLGPGQAARTVYHLPADRRGVFNIGPLELRLTDPFGLVSRNEPGAPPSVLTVHPRVDRVLAPPVTAGFERESAEGATVLGLDGEEFYAVREYRTGDDLRRVHWSSTARLGEVMIRQEEALRTGRLTLGVDLRREVWEDAGGPLEEALSAAASVADAGLWARLQVRLVTTAPSDTGFGTSVVHRAAILDSLAIAGTHGPPRPASTGAGTAPSEAAGSTGISLALLLGSAGHTRGSGALVVITSERATPADLVSVGRMGRGGRLLTVVVVSTGSHASGAPAVPLRATVVRTGPGAPFAEAWDRAMASQGRLRFAR
jgi:uncharacterized protein (DUF58 family)